MKNKIISWVVLTSLLSLWLISFANADFWKFSPEEKQQIEGIMKKVKSWATLSADEKAKLNELWKYKDWSFIWKIWRKWWKHFWMMLNNLTTEEQKALKTMTDEQKKAFFEKKKQDRQIEMESHRNVINKLIDGVALTSDEQVVLQDIKKIRDDRKQAMAERQTLMDEIKPILDKVKTWKTLTTDEQTKLDNFKLNNKWFWREGWMHLGCDMEWFMWK